MPAAVEPTFYKTNACQKLKCETIFWVKTPAKTHLTPEELLQTLKMMPAKPISFRLIDSLGVGPSQAQLAFLQARLGLGLLAIRLLSNNLACY